MFLDKEFEIFKVVTINTAWFKEENIINTLHTITYFH